MPGHQKLRKKLLMHKAFLKSLYSEKCGKVNVIRIERSTKKERGVLFQIMFCICQGHIPIKKQDFEKIRQANRKPKLQDIGKNLKKFLRSSESEQKKVLKQFSSLFPQLLRQLFEQ